MERIKRKIGILFATIVFVWVFQNTKPSSLNTNYVERKSVFESRRNLLVDDFGARVNERVRTLRQFDPTMATFEAAKEGGKVVIFPDMPDPEPQQIVDSYVAGSKADGPHYLEGCRATSQFQLGTFWSPWILETLDSEGTLKGYGGDELYVTYRDETNDSVSPTAVARVVDMADGRYMLYFLKSRSPKLSPHGSFVPSGKGTLTVRLIHTCGASSIEPPGKETPVGEGESGYIGTSYSIDVSAPALGQLIMNPTQFPELLTAYDLIVAYGDSVMQGLFSLNQNVPRIPTIHKVDHWEDGIWNVPLNSNTLDDNDRDEKIIKFLPRLLSFAEDAKLKNSGTFRDDRSAFLLGSCAWDLSSHNNKSSWKEFIPYDFVSFFEMEDHLESIRSAVGTLRTQYPQWDIYWMGCTCIHRQHAKNPKLMWASWYSNSIRARNLETRQRELMKELGVYYLDFFEASYEMEEFYHDHVHFTGDLGKPIFNHLINNNVLGDDSKLSY